MKNLNYNQIYENIYVKIKDNWKNIIVYLIILVAFVSAYILEHKDLYKENRNLGAVYEKGIPTETDTLSELLSKIRITSRYDVSSVYWRRCIIVSTIITFILIIISYRRLPSALELIYYFVLIYLVLYMFLNYYRDNLSIPSSEHIRTSTTYIQNKLNNDLNIELTVDDLIELYKENTKSQENTINTKTNL